MAEGTLVLDYRIYKSLSTTAQTTDPRVSRTRPLFCPRLAWRVLLQLLWEAA